MHRSGVDSARFFGCNLAERAVYVAHSELVPQPPNNKQFDFITLDGKKIDVKAAHANMKGRIGPRWLFTTNENKLADEFWFIGFADDDYPRVLAAWAVSSSVLSHRGSVEIRDNAKWEPFKFGADRIARIQSAIDALAKDPALKPKQTRSDVAARITATIRPDQKAWLADHPAVNVSGLLQEAIDKIMMASRTDNYKF